MSRHVQSIIPVLIFAASFVLFAAVFFPTGAPAGVSGAPGDSLCTDCHFSPSGSGGSVVIEGPESYMPGTTIELTVRAQRPGSERFGFQITARGESETMVGTFVPGEGQQFASNGTAPDPAYITHSNAPFDTDNDDMHEWTVLWEPPDEPDGVVIFYAAANTANGDGTPFFDTIYSTSFSLPSATAIQESPEIPAIVHAEPPFPNPATIRSTLSFELARSNPVHIELVNAEGRTVSSQELGFLSPGPHSSTLDVQDLAAGVYVYRIVAGTEQVTGRILVIR